MAGAQMAVTPYNAKARPRFSGGKVSPRMACAIGCKPPPNAPCKTRNRRRSPRLGAIPHRRELAVEGTMHVNEKRFRPRHPTSHPLLGGKIAFQTKLIVRTHLLILFALRRI